MCKLGFFFTKLNFKIQQSILCISIILENLSLKVSNNLPIVLSRRGQQFLRHMIRVPNFLHISCKAKIWFKIKLSGFN